MIRIPHAYVWLLAKYIYSKCVHECAKTDYENINVFFHKYIIIIIIIIIVIIIIIKLINLFQNK